MKVSDQRLMKQWQRGYYQGHQFKITTDEVKERLLNRAKPNITNGMTWYGSHRWLGFKTEVESFINGTLHKMSPGHLNGDVTICFFWEADAIAFKLAFL